MDQVGLALNKMLEKNIISGIGSDRISYNLLTQADDFATFPRMYESYAGRIL